MRPMLRRAYLCREQGRGRDERYRMSLSTSSGPHTIVSLARSAVKSIQISAKAPQVRAVGAMFESQAPYSNRLNIATECRMFEPVEHREQGEPMLYINNPDAYKAIAEGCREDNGQHVVELEHAIRSTPRAQVAHRYLSTMAAAI